MAVTAESSTQVTNVDATPVTLVDVNEWMGRLRFFLFNFTQGAAAGDAGSTAQLVKLPGGDVRLVLPLSHVRHSAFGASRTLDLGWEAYTDNNGDAVAADPNGLDDGVNVSAAGSFTPAGTVSGDETYEFSNRGGVYIAAQCNDGTLPAAGTLDGFFVAVID